MNITKYIPSIHNWYVEQREYRCKECGGKGIFRPCNHDGCYNHLLYPCEACNGTGQHKNIGELLAEIAGLLAGDALTAHKEKKFVDYNKYENNLSDKDNDKKVVFILYLFNKFEDCIAQAFIKLFDLAGYLKMDLDYSQTEKYSCTHNMNERLYLINRALPDLWMFDCKNEQAKNALNLFYIALLNLCKWQNIPIEKHIDARLQYMGVKVRRME